MAAATRQASKEQESFADQANTMQSLAQLAPTSARTHLAGAAMRGLKNAAGI
jgi:hypothetical protein